VSLTNQRLMQLKRNRLNHLFTIMRTHINY
jgi:hypothetical protein